MKKLYPLLLLVALLMAGRLRAEEHQPKDTATVVDIEEVVVIASPKENARLRQMPAASSLISGKDMQRYRINSLKGLSGVVPNLFIPDYGSRMTSAVYIRGIGARINTPAVGLYVDNIPYIDKSAFDFSFYDIERVDVLRGPQATLYGRNTMGGLVKVHTRSPFSYQGTDLRLGAATYGDYNASLTHYHRISDRFAFSAGGFYEHQGGCFRNHSSSVDRNADWLDGGGGRVRAVWLPSGNLKLDFSLGYEYGRQGGYAYGLYDEATGKVAPVCYNDESTYRRGLLNGGLNVGYQADRFVLNAVTGYQHLDDRMFLDQDFTDADIFNLLQEQRLNTVSEEVMLKSKPGADWQWTTGVSGFYQGLSTQAPVTFKREGVEQQIEANINRVFAAIPFPSMRLRVNNERLRIPGSYETPVLSGAVYHQSTYRNLLVEGLSATVGLRLEYEKMRLDYDSGNDPMDFDFDLSFAPGRPGISFEHLEARSALRGSEEDGYLHLLPKFALQYDIDQGNNLYVSVSKGYRSGGYNIQLFSDLVQGGLRNAMADALKQKMTQDYGMTDEQANQLLAGNIPGYGTEPDIRRSTVYKPEYSWNYEAGAHLALFGNRLLADMAVFYMDTHDQQIARFSENGYGRMTVNAGRSRSVGVEAALQARPAEGLSLHASYGLTRATFRDYVGNLKDGDGEVVTADYGGNFVPFVPRHTFTAGADYTFRFDRWRVFDNLTLDLYYSAAGKIFWTERNDICQPFYGTLNARLSTRLKGVQVDLWGGNLTGERYAAFYFETMGRPFMQPGKPRRFGIDLRFRF